MLGLQNAKAFYNMVSIIKWGDTLFLSVCESQKDAPQGQQDNTVEEKHRFLPKAFQKYSTI